MKWTRMLALLLIAFLLGGLFGCKKQDKTDMEMVLLYRDKAQAYLDAGDYQAARDILEEGALHTGDKQLLALMKEVETRMETLETKPAADTAAPSDSTEPTSPPPSSDPAPSETPAQSEAPAGTEPAATTEAPTQPPTEPPTQAPTQAPTEPPAPAAPNLMDSFTKAERKRINIFLSNFSEIGFGNFYGESDYDPLTLEDYAYLHYKINDSSKLSYKDSCYVMSKSNMDHCLNRFFGFTIEPKTRSDDSYGYNYTVEYKNSAYYFPAADGESYNFLTVVNHMSKTDWGAYQVSFDVYELDIMTYFDKGISDSYYELTAAQAEARSDLTKIYSGTAVVRDYKNGDFKSYQLLGYFLE